MKQKIRKNAILSLLHITLSLYFKKYKHLRTKYIKLKKMFLLLLRSRKSFLNKKNTNSIYLLLLKLNILKR